MTGKFSYVVPIYHVSDLDEAASFFEKIGFRREWCFGTPPTYAGLYSASDHIVHLMQTENPPQASAGLYIQVEDVLEVYANCQAAGIQAPEPPADRPYGMSDFAITGPEGIHITFGQELESEESD